MRTLLVAALGLVVVFADNPAQAQSPTHNWSGFYAGLHAGGAWGDTDVDVGCNDVHSIFPGYCALAAPSGVPPSNFSPDMSGYLGGGQAGYNFQSGNWVFGVEADIPGPMRMERNSRVSPGESFPATCRRRSIGLAPFAAASAGHRKIGCCMRLAVWPMAALRTGTT